MFEEFPEIVQALLRSANEGITLSDPHQPDCPLLYVNPAFERITGYSAAEVHGRNCRFLQGEGTDSRAVEVIRQALASHTAVTTELVNYHKDGSPFWNRLSLSPVLNEDGTLRYYMGIQMNITPLKRAEEAQRAYAEALRHANVERERTMFALSNELRDSITACDTISSLLLQQNPGFPPERAQEYLRQINLTVRHMVNTLDSILLELRTSQHGNMKNIML